MQLKILVFDQKYTHCTFWEGFLSKNGYKSCVSHDEYNLRYMLRETSFDLALLDLDLPPGKDATYLVWLLSDQYNLPLILLGSQNARIGKTAGLKMGAKAYLQKPFDPQTLVTHIQRMEKILRHPCQAAANPRDTAQSGVFHFAGWQLDTQRFSLFSPENEEIHLTGYEYSLLFALLKRHGTILTRDYILELIAGRSWQPEDRSVDVLIAKLRRKLRENPPHTRFIKTLRGMGYTFIAPDISFEQHVPAPATMPKTRRQPAP